MRHWLGPPLIIGAYPRWGQAIKPLLCRVVVCTLKPKREDSDRPKVMQGLQSRAAKHLCDLEHS